MSLVEQVNNIIYDASQEFGGITQETLNEAFRLINQREYNWRSMDFDFQVIDALFDNYEINVSEKNDESYEDVNWFKEGF